MHARQGVPCLRGRGQVGTQGSHEGGGPARDGEATFGSSGAPHLPGSHTTEEKTGPTHQGSGSPGQQQHFMEMTSFCNQQVQLPALLESQISAILINTPPSAHCRHTNTGSYSPPLLHPASLLLPYHSTLNCRPSHALIGCSQGLHPAHRRSDWAKWAVSRASWTGARSADQTHAAALSTGMRRPLHRTRETNCWASLVFYDPL